MSTKRLTLLVPPNLHVEVEIRRSVPPGEAYLLDESQLKEFNAIDGKPKGFVQP